MPQPSALLGGQASRSGFHPLAPSAHHALSGAGRPVVALRGPRSAGGATGRRATAVKASAGPGSDAIHAVPSAAQQSGPHHNPQELHTVAVTSSTTLHPSQPPASSFLSAAAAVVGPLLLAGAALTTARRVWLAWAHQRQRAHYPDAALHSGEYFDTSEALGNLAEAMKNPAGPRERLMEKAHSLSVKARMLKRRQEPGAQQLEAYASAVEASVMASIDSDHGDSHDGACAQVHGREGEGCGGKQDAQVRPE